jgi:hypothetical protein
MLILALAFLFETWVWDSLAAALGWIARRIPWQRIRRAAKDIINRLPAIVAVLLFGVPVVVMEGGCAVAVLLVALGHVVIGTILYGLLKLVGVSSIAVIYDLTSEKLMTLPWFVWLYAKFERLHELAHRLVEPYKRAALSYLRELKVRLRVLWRGYGFGDAAVRARKNREKSKPFDTRPELD